MKLKKLYYSPLVTNASLNRDKAAQCFNAGMTVRQVAENWPKVFRILEGGVISQIYDSQIMDGSGRLETKYTILQSSVDKAIKAHKRKANKGTEVTA